MSERHNIPIGALASGSGTTFESLGHSIAANNLPLELRLLVVDRPGVKALRVAELLNKTYHWDIRVETVDHETYPKGATERKWDMTDEQSEVIAEYFSAEDIFLGAQLGLLSRTRGVFFDQYGALDSHTQKEQAALVNTHPGLLWQTKGLWGSKVHEKVVQDGSSETAQTLHVVTSEYDEGAIIAENRVAVLPGFTAEEVEAAVQSVEKQFIGPDITRFALAREAYLYQTT